MDWISGPLASFGTNPGLRIAAGLFFFLLLGIWFFRRFNGRGKIVFLAICLLSGLLFYFIPASQLLAFFLLVLLLILSVARPPGRPTDYLPAEALVEGGGVKRGLTAPEAAIILEMPIHRVLGVVILGLLKKRILVVEAHEPLTLRIEQPFDIANEADPLGRSERRRMAAREMGIILQSYEDPFLEQLSAQKGRPLGEVNLTAAARAMLRYTARRIRGYSLEETRAYYRKHLGRARHDDQFFEWLVLDADFADLYRAYRPEWIQAAGGEDLAGREEPLVDWVEGLVHELSTSIPPGGLQVRDEAGSHLTIGGTDSISDPFFAAIMREVV
jgi:hypothetical protein